MMGRSRSTRNLLLASAAAGGGNRPAPYEYMNCRDAEVYVFFTRHVVRHVERNRCKGFLGSHGRKYGQRPNFDAGSVRTGTRMPIVGRTLSPSPSPPFHITLPVRWDARLEIALQTSEVTIGVRTQILLCHWHCVSCLQMSHVHHSD